VVVSAEARDMEREYPQDSEFRQDNDFFYLTGLETRGLGAGADRAAGRCGRGLYPSRA
jgi:hypothetical protein